MALALHHQSTAGSPEDWPTTKKICELLVRMNRVEDALAECGSFAEICAAQGQFRKAVGAWKYATSLKPSALDPYLRIGDLYARQGYKPEAKGLYALVVDECIKLGKLAEAADALRKIVAIDPDDSKAAVRLAEFYSTEGNPESAVDLYTHVARRLDQKGHRKDACQLLKHAMRCLPKSERLRMEMDRLDGSGATGGPTMS